MRRPTILAMTVTAQLWLLAASCTAGSDASAPLDSSQDTATPQDAARDPDPGEHEDAAGEDEADSPADTGGCKSTADCDDEDECTDDACDPATGTCSHEPAPDCLPCIEEAVPFVAPTLAVCCVGLAPVPECEAGAAGCECPDCDCFVCTACGDGDCGPAENECNCPADCEPAECAGAGEPPSTVPGAAPCCAGLDVIPKLPYDPVTGACPSESASMLCTDCGNGKCEEWESPCTCTKDCPPVDVSPCLLPDVPCAAGEYCKGPPATCGSTDVFGSCTEIPAACPETGAPVCGCDEKTYGSECELEKAMVSKDYDAACVKGCLHAGDTFEDSATSGKCCPGLAPIPVCDVLDGACACASCPCYVCSACGDGKCSAPIENECSCPEDCKAGLSSCLYQGGFCATVPPEGPKCPEGWQTEATAVCGLKKACCVPEKAICEEEGGVKLAVAGALPCCDGLVEIPVTEVSSSGCIPKVGAAYCAKCGNGLCEPWWESPCSCPDDCESASSVCYGGGLVKCPANHYCKYPPGVCGSLGKPGACVAIPAGCDEGDHTVCGCDGSTYLNECELELGGVSKAYDGECAPDCAGAGETVGGMPTIWSCCPGLVPIPACAAYGDACECPDEPASVCAPCGDGKCDESENQCTCPADCDASGNECEEGGGACLLPIFGGKPCPPGMAPIFEAGCMDDQICCTKADMPPA